MKLYLFILALIISSSQAFAQQTANDPNAVFTIRSVNVLPQDLWHKKYWCEYTVDKAMENFFMVVTPEEAEQPSMLEPEKKALQYRNEMREDFKDKWISWGGRASCLWKDACELAWDKNEFILEGAVRSSKGIQDEILEQKIQKIHEYNEQAESEGQPKMRVPVTPSQLHGNTDVTGYRFIHIPLNEYKNLMKKECMMYQLVEGIQIHIDPNIFRRNEEQDEAYSSAAHFARGLYNNIHYHYTELQQSHVLYTIDDQIYSGYYVFHLTNDSYSRKP